MSAQKVSIAKLDSYEPAAVRQALERCLKALGGISQSLAGGKRTALKPNLLSASEPGKAVTTHPSIVQAAGDMVREAGGDPFIVDSPGGGYAFTKEKLWSVYNETRMNGTDIGLNYDTSYRIVHDPAGRIIKRFEVLSAVLDAGSIINLCKLKTHTLTVLSAAVKNMFGVVPGRLKIGYHGRFEDEDDFARMLLDLCYLMKPQLSILDAVVSMEGDGPNRGTPVKTGFIAASHDPLSLDLAAAELAGCDPQLVPHLKIAISEGLIPGSAKELPVECDFPPGFVMKKIRLPVTVTTKRGGLIAKVIKKILYGWFKRLFTVRPIVNQRLCEKCLVCVKACPTHAAMFINGRVSIDPGDCIRCYCCHEQCPYGAIDLKEPPFPKWGGFK